MCRKSEREPQLTAGRKDLDLQFIDYLSIYLSTIWEFLSLVISCESLHTAELFYLEMLLTGEVDGKDGKKENKRIEVTTDCSERRV